MMMMFFFFTTSSSTPYNVFGNVYIIIHIIHKFRRRLCLYKTDLLAEIHNGRDSTWTRQPTARKEKKMIMRAAKRSTKHGKERNHHHHHHHHHRIIITPPKQKPQPPQSHSTLPAFTKCSSTLVLEFKRSLLWNSILLSQMHGFKIG